MRFRLATTGGKEQQVDDIPITMQRIRDAPKGHENVCKLKRSPARRIVVVGLARESLSFSPPRGCRHGSIGEAEGH